MSQCQSNAKREVLIVIENLGFGQPSPVQAKAAAVVTYILPNVRNFFTKHNQIDKTLILDDSIEVDDKFNRWFSISPEGGHWNT